MKYDYVFFDFNGTILNDVDLCLELLNTILNKQGKKSLNIKEYREVFCFPIRSYYQKAGVDFDLESFEALGKWFIDEYQPRSLKECSLYPNFIDLVKYLKSKNIKVGVLSASESNNLKMQLKHFEIDGLFDVILGIDNIYAASKVEVGKNYILENNLDPKRILFIGDTDHDALVGKEIGANVVLYGNGHQSLNVLEKCNLPIINDFLSLESML